MLKALAAVVGQFFEDRPEAGGTLWHDHLYAGQCALASLQEFGLVEPAENGGFYWTELGRQIQRERYDEN